MRYSKICSELLCLVEFYRDRIINSNYYIFKRKLLGRLLMHFAISASWGPTDPTRAMLPFIFAASALQANDEITIMLFHDAVHLASKGVAKNILPVGPPPRFEEVYNHINAKIIVCKPCAEVRNIFKESCLEKIIFAGMNDFHIASSLPNTRIITY